MAEKHRKLRTKQDEMNTQETSFRDELGHLNQALYVLQQQVRKSNELQQRVVEIFGSTGSKHATTASTIDIYIKARDALKLCQEVLQHNHPRKTVSSAGGPGMMKRQGSLEAAQSQLPTQSSQPLQKGQIQVLKNESKDNEKDTDKDKNIDSKKDKDKDKDNDNDNDANGSEKTDKLKKRARSYSDLAVPKAAVFEEEMAKFIIDIFPNVIKSENGPHGVIDYVDENANVAKVFELYHRYYCEIHLPREMELSKIRTQCEQKYNSLRYVSNKKQLARREEGEIDWIMSEMKRAIDRLNREGVPLAPNEEKELYSRDDTHAHSALDNHSSEQDKTKAAENQHDASEEKSSTSKISKTHKNKDQNGGGKGSASDEPSAHKHRNSSTVVPVLAHRSTWSEASEVIFQLNFSRQQQYQATKELEESLKSRELVKSWYEEKILPMSS
ncbi:hypothetical protein RFI_12391 [Reticulomyxa filosa]|uniref:Uncharacterized protein n=1 Tax=Reticulomyxa filosa TaxID=46433 RepID=X6NFU6_RETFI|nr:hypothetical protein RFI_12391 [Reticulomyxa filosa]|eukprot:ETO24768.1 hypothetical protein RFI_12391 [Reticulomyxa filosa]